MNSERTVAVESDPSQVFARTVELVQLEAEFANRQLEAAFTRHDPLYPDMAREMKLRFNKTWEPYIGKPVTVLGQWHRPISIDRSVSGIRLDIQKEEVERVAQSAGFSIEKVPVRGRDVPQLVMLFDLPRTQLWANASSFSGQFTMRAYAEPREVELLLGKHKSELSHAKVVRAISEADWKLRTYTRLPQSRFFQLQHDEQEGFVSSVLHDVESRIIEQEGLDFRVRTRLMHYKSSDDNLETVVQPAGRGEPFDMAARLLGVTTLDRLVETTSHRYRTPAETKAADSGICMILDPIAPSFRPELVDDGYVFVPFRAIHKQLLSGRSARI